jgi:hypothetical protein
MSRGSQGVACASPETDGRADLGCEFLEWKKSGTLRAQSEKFVGWGVDGPAFETSWREKTGKSARLLFSVIIVLHTW